MKMVLLFVVKRVSICECCCMEQVREEKFIFAIVSYPQNHNKPSSHAKKISGLHAWFTFTGSERERRRRKTTVI